MGVLGVVRVVLVFALVAMVAAGLTTAARATPSKQVSLDAVVTFSTGWCCGTSTDFAGEAVLPGIGRVDYTGNHLAGCLFFPGDVSYPCFRRLDIAFVARDGSSLSLEADADWTFPVEEEPTQLTWSIDPADGSGRLAGLAGSGTYTFESNGLTATIVLWGLMHRVHSLH